MNNFKCLYCAHHECENPGIPLCMKNYIITNDCSQFEKIEKINDVINSIHKDISCIINEYKLEVNGSYEHKLSDTLMAKDSFNDIVDMYFEELKKELDEQV